MPIVSDDVTAGMNCPRVPAEVWSNVRALTTSGAFADLLVFLSGALNVVDGGILGAVETGDEHLCDPHIFSPRDAPVLILAQFIERKVAAHAGQACVVNDGSELLSAVFHEAAETGVCVADG